MPQIIANEKPLNDEEIWLRFDGQIKRFTTKSNAHIQMSA